MNISLFFFVLGLGLVSANVKDDLVHRLVIGDKQLSEAQKRYSTHGFDYFAGIVGETLTKLRHVASEVNKLPANASETDAEALNEELGMLEKHIPEVIKFPALHEVFKSGALYPAAMKEHNHDKSQPTPETLRKKIVEIIIQENHIKTLNGSSNTHFRETAQKTLDEMFQKLYLTIKDIKQPDANDILELAVLAEKRMEQYNKHSAPPGRTEEAKLFKDALFHYSSMNHHLAKLYPIDSIAKMNEFSEVAARHYPFYRILSGMVFADSIDCFKNPECKKELI